MKILIIIPAYNESENIERVVDNIIKHHSEYDYLIVNDYSTDGTEAICAARNYNYISLPVNLGIGGGVQSGYLYALSHDYDVAVQLDGDGQHNPEYIKNLLEPLEEKRADMVVGSRFIDKKGFQSSFMRRMGITIINRVIKICCGVTVTDATSGFRAVNRNLIKVFSKDYAQDYPEPEAIVTAVLSRHKIVEVPVIMREREEGVSSINLIRSVYYMVKVSLALIINRIGSKTK
jgi:glycosyltransferase involved in cell wall biosynthesis